MWTKIKFQDFSRWKLLDVHTDPCHSLWRNPKQASQHQFCQFSAFWHSTCWILVAVWCNLLKVNFCSKGWCQRGVRCRGDSVEASSTVPIEDRWRRWRSLCTGIRFRLVAGVVFDTDIIYIILYADTIWYILDDNHTWVIGECWTMLLVALSGTAAVRPRIWQFAAERLFKLKVSRYVQYVQMISNMFRCV